MIAFASGFGKIRWRTRIGPTESSPLVADGRVYVGDWRGRVYALDGEDRPVRWTFQGKGRIKGGGREVGQPALRRHLRRLPLRDPRDDGQGDLADAVAGPARRPGAVLLDAGGRVRARLHRLHGRQGLLLRRREREAALVEGDGRLRLRLAGRLAQTVYAARTAAASTRSTRPPATSAGVSAPRATSPARRPCSNGVVYFSTFDEVTYALDARTGKLLWTYKDGKYAGVVADRDRLYLVGHARVYGMVEK